MIPGHIVDHTDKANTVVSIMVLIDTLMKSYVLRLIKMGFLYYIIDGTKQGAIVKIYWQKMMFESVIID